VFSAASAASITITFTDGGCFMADGWTALFGNDSISISWLRLSLIPAKDMQMPREQTIGENVSYLAAALRAIDTVTTRGSNP